LTIKTELSSWPLDSIPCTRAVPQRLYFRWKNRRANWLWITGLRQYFWTNRIYGVVKTAKYIISRGLTWINA